MKKQNNSSINNNLARTKTGVGLLIDQSIRASAKLPMLDMIYEKFVSSIALPMRDMLNSEVVINPDSIQSHSFAEYIKSLKDGYVFGVYSSPDLSGNFAVALSSELILMCIALFLGGDSSSKETSDLYRKLTSIEMEIVKYLFGTIVKHLIASFTSILHMHCNLDRIEIDKNVLKIAKNDDSLCILKVTMIIRENKSSFDIVFPYNSLESIKKILAQPFLQEKVLQDPQWFDHLEKEVKTTKVLLELVLDGAASKVSELLDLQVGNTVVLDKFAEEHMDVEINGVKATLGKLGKAGDKVAVKLLEDINIAKFNHMV